MREIDNDIVEAQVSQCLGLIQGVLGQDLLGMYLHGSSIVGGLQKFSDIDLLVISNRTTTPTEKTKLASEMLSVSGVYGISKDRRPVELTLVKHSEIKPWHYPPKFDFQYGDWLRKDFESGNFTPWVSDEMPNLAIEVTQVLLASKTIFGLSPKELLVPVPYKDFITATTKEIDTLLDDLSWDTRNVLLTYARIWSTVETDAIRSKPDAAAWVIDRLPSEYQSLMKRARAICLGEEPEHWDDWKHQIRPFAEYMIGKIKQDTSLLTSSDYDKRSITLT
jgi:predicted nucleotidyltransferase